MRALVATATATPTTGAPAAAPSPPARLGVRAGDRLPDTTSAALHALFGDFAALLVLRATSTPRQPSVVHYADVLLADSCTGTTLPGWRRDRAPAE